MPEESHSEDAEQEADGGIAPASLIVARSIARALWLPEFKAANPDAGPAEIKSAWRVVRHARSKPVRQEIRSLEKRGFAFTAPVVMPGEDSDSESVARPGDQA